LPASDGQRAYPDETTILAFRHLLEKNNLGEQIFAAEKAHLKERGMAMKQGTIINATLIAAPSSTKNKAGERDPEMHQTKKGNNGITASRKASPTG
jgi:IS5 family transposase